MNETWSHYLSRWQKLSGRLQFTLACMAVLMAIGLGMAVCLIFPGREPDYRKQWFSAEFATNNAAHPMHLSLPGADTGFYDILTVENLSSEPLSILAFSSRPRLSGLTGEQIMSTWAQWIATARQGIIVEPHSTWVMNPSNLEKLPAIHGHTWICIFFSAAHAGDGALPATVLPSSFGGRFCIRYCLSQLPEDQVAVPQMHRQNLVKLLQYEVDASDKSVFTLASRDISNHNGLTALELR
jgi:hypothetical protein